MSERSCRRLVVLQVLVLSLLVTLSAGSGTSRSSPATTYETAAAENRIREVVMPAAARHDPRRPRPAARRATAPRWSSRSAAPSCCGRRTTARRSLDRLAGVHRHAARRVWAEDHALCGTGTRRAAAAGTARRTSRSRSPTRPTHRRWRLQILERREDFPGVTAELTAVREYPSRGGANAAHVLGYLGPVTDDEIATERRAAPTRPSCAQRPDRPRRAGGEYDEELRGNAGRQHAGGRPPRRRHRHAGRDAPPSAGNHLVTTIDAKVQAVAEKALQRRDQAGPDQRRHQQGHRQQAQGRLRRGRRDGRPRPAASSRWPATRRTTRTSGSAASAPRTKPSSAGRGTTGVPLSSRAIQGQFAPALDLQGGLAGRGGEGGLLVRRVLRLPAAYSIGGNRAKRNFESQGYGPINLGPAHRGVLRHGLLQFAYETVAAGRRHSTRRRRTPRTRGHQMAQEFGLGRRPASTCPASATGRIADRAGSRRTGRRPRTSTAKAKTGYPEVRATRAARLPGAAVEGELRRRLARPRR